MIVQRYRALFSTLLVVTLVCGWIAPTTSFADEPTSGDGTPVIEIVTDATATEVPDDQSSEPTPVVEAPTAVPTEEVQVDVPAEPTAVLEATVELGGVGLIPFVEFSQLTGVVGTTIDFSVEDFPPSAQLQVIQTDAFANQRLVTTSSTTEPV